MELICIFLLSKVSTLFGNETNCLAADPRVRNGNAVGVRARLKKGKKYAVSSLDYSRHPHIEIPLHFRFPH